MTRFHRSAAQIFTLCLILGTYVGPPVYAQEILNPIQEDPGCMGPEDPFCDSGGIYDGGGGGGGGGTCQYCKFTTGFVFECATTPLGEPGKTECTATSDGLQCSLSGSGCTRI